MLLQRPFCKKCNRNRAAVNYKREGVTHYRSICDECGRKQQKQKPQKANWTKSGYKKKATCDLCGFKSLFSTQITVFHVDGNLDHVEHTNLRSICLNCIEVVKKKDVKWRRGDLEIGY